MAVPEANPAKLLLRHAGTDWGHRLLVMECPRGAESAILTRLGPGRLCLFHNTDYVAHRHIAERAAEFAEAGTTALFGPWLTPPRRDYDSCVLFLSSSRELNEMLFAQAARATSPGARMWIAGSIRAGARSMREAVQERLGRIERSFSGHHSVLFSLARNAEGTGRQSLEDWLSWYEVEFSGRRLRLASLPGVFSRGRLDPGTRLLMETLGDPGRGKVLDFGCGNGVLGAAIRQSWPGACVDLVDVSALALACARKTLCANGLSQDNVWISDGLAEVPLSYDLIISNPPIHSGGTSDWTVSESLARHVSQKLNPGGRFRLVTNQPAHWQRLLKRNSMSDRVLAQAASYKVLEAVRARNVKGFRSPDRSPTRSPADGPGRGRRSPRSRRGRPRGD